MKTSKIDRLVSVAVIGICLVKAILYGGSKPPTNDLTGAMGVSPVAGSAVTTDAGAMGVSPVAEGEPDGQDARRPSAFRPMMAMSHQPTNQFANQLTNWTARGAWNDWRRIDFPDGFAFPYGTNLLTGVTLLSNGEIRENLHCSPSTFTLSLPLPVSLEPDVSACAYGMTASNSFVFAWIDACVEREATNRVVAAIELFASGDVQVRFGNSVTNIPAVRPEGFVGIGQDTNWVAAAFADDIAAISNKGYEAWLMEDCVGINEQNGMYKVSITVSQLPDFGPCYLVCGPYKVVVTEPGTYSFPLEVFEHYTARTYPVAVPLSINYDDGYRSDDPDQGMLCMSPPRQLLGVPLIFPPIYDIWQEPRLVISPDEIPLDQAEGTRVSLWCNVSGAVQRYCRSIWRTTKVIFRGSREAEVVEAIIADEVEFILEHTKGSCSAILSITPPADDDDDEPRPHSCCFACCGDGCLCDGSCCACNCGCRSGGNVNTNTPPNASQP